jgi:hypothetical protein
MSVFRKIFGSISKTEKEHQKKEDENTFLIKKDTPIDESFTIKFNENGGKFLYCENIDEVYDFLGRILEENRWKEKSALVLNSNLKKRFKDFDWNTTEVVNDGHFLFTTCEYLISNDGSILISSKQIAEKKLNELPKNFIVFATTSQIVQTIGEGLHGIKAKNKKNIPTNITTIKHFKVAEDDNFLSYGSSSKNLYLLLLEDL